MVEAFDLKPFITSGSRGWAKYYSDRGALFLRITNLSRSWIYPDLSDKRLVEVPEGDTEGQRTSLLDGDILISITADIGVIGYVDAEIPKPAYINQHIACLRIIPSKADSRFQSYYLASEGPQKRFLEMTDIGAKSGINLTTVGKLKLLSPPVPEQRAIAEALSDADALIAALEAMIAKKRDLKQAAMQQLLTGKTRLPGFSGAWATQTLFEVSGGKKELFDDGDWIEFEHITNKGVRLVQTGNIGVGRFVEKEKRKYIFEESFISLRCKEISPGDLLICRLAEPAGRACVLPDIGEGKIVTSVDVTIARPSEQNANRVFLANLLSTPDWFRAVSDRSGGTTHKRVARGALGKIELFLPPVTEQTAIADVLSDMDADLAALEARAAKARAVKQGMMQQLLTGKVRLI